MTYIMPYLLKTWKASDNILTVSYRLYANTEQQFWLLGICLLLYNLPVFGPTCAKLKHSNDCAVTIEIMPIMARI